MFSQENGLAGEISTVNDAHSCFSLLHSTVSTLRQAVSAPHLTVECVDSCEAGRYSRQTQQQQQQQQQSKLASPPTGSHIQTVLGPLSKAMCVGAA